MNSVCVGILQAAFVLFMVLCAMSFLGSLLDGSFIRDTLAWSAWLKAL